MVYKLTEGTTQLFDNARSEAQTFFSVRVDELISEHDMDPYDATDQARKELINMAKEIFLSYQAYDEMWQED